MEDSLVPFRHVLSDVRQIISAGRTAAYAATARIHLVSSFLCSVLIGADAPVDTGDGAGMNLLDLGRGAWDGEICAFTAPDLVRRLPAVRNGRAGSLAPYFTKYGLRAGIPVAAFTGDNPASLVGTGADKPSAEARSWREGERDFSRGVRGGRGAFGVASARRVGAGDISRGVRGGREELWERRHPWDIRGISAQSNVFSEENPLPLLVMLSRTRRIRGLASLPRVRV